MTLREVGIDDSKFKEMAAAAVKHGNLQYAYVPLDQEDVYKIFGMCL